MAEHAASLCTLESVLVSATGLMEVPATVKPNEMDAYINYEF